MKSSLMKSILYSAVVISLCLQCWSMTPAQTPQPTPTPDPRDAAANKALEEGFSLFQQGTAESLRAALGKYETARSMFSETKNQLGEADSLLGLGRINDLFGEKQQALAYYNQALPLYRAVENKMGEATTLTNIGLVYHLLSKQQTALGYYEQALSLYRAISYWSGEAVMLNNIGGVYNNLKQEQKALEYYKKALPLLKALRDRSVEAITLNNIGGVYSSLGERQKALEYYNQALPLSRAVGDRSGEAATLNNMGFIYHSIGEKQTALEYYNQALPLRRVVGDRSGEATTLSNLMLLWQNQKNPRFAIYYGKQAINLLQQLRANIQGLEKETQQAFLKSVESDYRYLADLLIAQGRIPEAEQVLAMLKDEELFQYVRRDGDLVERLRQRADLNTLETKALAEYSKYGDRLTEIGSRLADLDKERLKFPADKFPQQAEYDQLKLQLEDARRVFLVFLRQLADEFGKSNEKVKQIESSLKADLKRWGANNVVII